jgi:hypothetical protein
MGMHVVQALSLLVCKVVVAQQPSSRMALFCRMCLQTLLRLPASIDELQAVFGALRQPQIRAELLATVKHVLCPWVAKLPPSEDSKEMQRRIKAVEAELKAPKSEAAPRDTVVFSD